MRRPPDKDGRPAMSERDVEISNATLNTVFGGSRQKAWMTGPGAAPVRPTPRSSTSKTSVSQAQLSQRAMAVFPSPAPSDEPSPILSHTQIVNGSRNENQRYVLDDENQQLASRALQSPTRHQYPTTNEATYQAPQATAMGDQTFRAASYQEMRPQAPQDLHLSFRENASPQSPTATSPPLISPVMMPVPPDRHSGTPPVQDLLSPTLSEQYRGQGQPQVPYQSPTSRDSPLPSTFNAQQPAETSTRTQPSQDDHIWRVSRDQLPSPIQAPTPSPTMVTAPYALPSTMLPPLAQAYPSGGSRPSYSHKRQRTQGPSISSLKSRVALISGHIESVGGMQNLNNGLERPRFQLLTDACKSDDAFYVALHQLFCLWDFSREEMANVHGLPNTNVLTLAFRILGQLIRDNEALAPSHLRWFAQFPSPLSDLLRCSESYRATVVDVGTFLNKLASEWTPMSRDCSSRGYPPLVDELVHRMGVLSPILQGVVFTASRRNLGIVDDDFGAHMEALFLQDRQGHQEMLSRYTSSQPPTEQDIKQRNQIIVERYLILRNRQRRQKHANGVTIGSPLAHQPSSTVSNNSQIQPTGSVSGGSMPVPSRPQPDNNQAVWTQRSTSPHLSENWQYSNNQIQPVQISTTGPPNTAASSQAGRPNVMNGQRIYQDALRPTIPQQGQMQTTIQRSQVLRSNTGPLLASSTSTSHTTGSQSQTVYVDLEQSVDQRPFFSMHSAPQAPQQLIQQIQQQQQLSQPRSQLGQQNQTNQQQQILLQQMQQQQAQVRNQLDQYDQHIQQQHQQQQQQHGQNQQQQQHHQQQRPVTGRHRSSRSRLVNIGAIDSQQHIHSVGHTVPVSSRHAPNEEFPGPAASPTVPGRVVGQGPAVMGSRLQIYAQTQPLRRPLVPPLGFVQPSHPTNPEMMALHQAHVRSPRLVAAGLPSDISGDHLSRRFYQSVKDFALGPTIIPPTAALSKFEFTVSEIAYGLVAKDKWLGTDRLPTRVFKPGTLQYRLRCIESKRDVTKWSIPDWVVTDTVWPETVFLEINDQSLEVRRKNHHGKDLPVDITRYILPSNASLHSINRVTVSIPTLGKATKDSNYFIGIEIIEILHHKQVMEMCFQFQRIPEAQTLNSIKKSLAGPSDVDDDDFAMVTSDLSVDLADPFTARIFETPVRGSSCLHRECFDLETYLLTRNSKVKRPQQPSMVDVWKCPLCGKDARPYSLQIDDFLVSVRTQLAEMDNLDVKAILVSADGSWRPKPKPQTLKRRATSDPNEDEDWSDDEDTKKKKFVDVMNQAALANKKQEIEVIELDDD